jgi:hypothetical protein
MTKTELKQTIKEIIQEEIQGYSKYIGKTKGLTSDELTRILTKIAKEEPSVETSSSNIKESEEKEYTVDYWYRYGKDGDDKEMDDITVKASSEAEALEKAKQQARRGAMSSSFEIRKRK